MGFQTKSILVVDDELDVTQLITFILKEFGFDVDSTHYGPEALELVKKNHYDLVITDLKMPVMIGSELASHIKELKPDMKIILITGGIDQDIKSSMDKHIADGWLYKPFKAREIISLVKEVLGVA